MEFTKVITDENGRRIYRSDTPITKGTNNFWTLSKAIKDLRNTQIKDGYELVGPTLETITEGFNLVCISDAITHSERLVFPAAKVKKIKTGDVFYSIFSFVQIAGKNTFLTTGGDTSTILEDKCYLEQIIKANKYNSSSS